MLDKNQISQFRKWAQGQGFSEIEIANEIARKNQEVTRQNVQKQSVTQKQAVQPIVKQPQQAQPQQNFLQKTTEATANFLIPRYNAVKNKIAGTLDIGKYQQSLQSTNEKLYEQSRSLLKQAMRTSDPVKKRQLLDQSRELDFSASSNTQKFLTKLDEFKKTTKLTGKESGSDMAGYYGREFVGLAGEGAMWALPVSKAVQGAVIIKGIPLVTKIIQGAIIGGTQSGIYNLTTPEDITIGDRAGKTARGALIGASIGGAIPAITSAGGSVLNSVKNFISNKAAQGYGKASPSLYQRALQEHGLDLNKIIKKYTPAGADYEKMLGNASERGSGGIIGERMSAAEKTINDAIRQSGTTIRVSGSDVIKELTKQQKSLKQTVGNKANVDALNTIIKETKELFKNGITAKKLLAIKRAADNKFGSAVVDESTGSVAAQAQKVLANFARSKLKTILPTVKKALDEETELYTLKEVLNRARGTANTQGSEIRVGQFQGLLDLVNPFKYGSAIVNNPTLSSILMRVTSQKKQLEDVIAKNGIKDAGTLSQKIIDTIIDTVKKGSFTQLAGDGGMQEQSGILDKIIQEEGLNTKQDEINNQQDEMIQIQNEETGEIKTVKKSELSQYGLGEQTNQNQGLINKKDIVIAMIADLEMTGGKNIPELKTILESYESVFEEDKNKEKKMSATTEKNVLLAQSGLRALNEIEKLLAKDPSKVWKSLVPGSLGARDYDSASFRAVEGLLRARSGAAVPETEVRRYMKANLPSFGDTEQEISFKLNAFRKDLEAVANSGSSYDAEQPLIQ